MESWSRSGIAGTSALFLSACASQGLYYWGDYETALYDRYVKEQPALAEQHLRETMLDAEQKGRKVPPGLYADYGFLLYRRGDMAGAVQFFEKEKQTFPESAVLMSKLIERIRRKQEPSPPTEPATPARTEEAP